MSLTQDITEPRHDVNTRPGQCQRNESEDAKAAETPSACWPVLAALWILTAAVAVSLYLLIWQEGALQNALLTSLPLVLAAGALARMRRFRSVPPRGPTPPAGNFLAVSRGDFAALSSRMLAHSRQRKEPLSLIVFELDGLPELRSIFGAEISRELLARFSRALQVLVSTRGLVVRTDTTVFAALLPGVQHEAALDAVRQALGPAVSLEFDAGEEEIILAPDFLIRSVPSDSASILSLYENMVRSMRHGRAREQRRQRYLRKEHESYCFPSSLATAADIDEAGRRGRAARIQESMSIQ